MTEVKTKQKRYQLSFKTNSALCSIYILLSGSSVPFIFLISLSKPSTFFSIPLHSFGHSSITSPILPRLQYSPSSQFFFLVFMFFHKLPVLFHRPKPPN
jgi:predicted membrane channel-forming protein YqfA (hemolysin III family)